jgi:tetratricopeptide (TPR) repeat protein
LKRFVVSALLALAAVARADQPAMGQLDASPTLFTVMAALNAAGYDADLNHSHPLRLALRDELAKRNIPSLVAIRDFVVRHRLSNESADLNQYISFGVTAGPPPNFEIKVRQNEIPPDVEPIQGFSALLAKFYQEAGIADLWLRSQREINRYIALYHSPVLNAVLEVNAYCRQQTNGLSNRHFQVFLELLEAPTQIQTRSYGNEYTVIVAPPPPAAPGQLPEPRTFDIRHAYLHYLLEPLATHYHEILERKKPLADHLGRAAGIGDAFRQDFLLLVSECLIKAVESRLDHNPKEVDQALHEGFILTPYFAEQLPLYEKQEQAMALYYPGMVGAIETMKEEQRLANVDFNSKPTERPAIKVVQAEAPLTGAAKTLDDAESLLAARQLDQAKELFLAALRQTDRKPLHAKAWYGLARIAMLRNDPESAEPLFQKSLDLGPEPQDKAWVLYYLGRLAVAAGERDRGVQLIQEALNLPGASELARKKAADALQEISKK